MSKEKHTATPWELIEPSDYAGPKAQCHFEIEADGLSVAMTIGDEVPEEEANAHFIVRAVNDYEADKEALRGVAIMLNTELAKHEREPWAQRVRAALADKKD